MTTTLTPLDAASTYQSDLGTSSRPSLSAAIRSEAIKLSTVRAYRLIASLTVLVGGFASFAVAALVTDQELTFSGVSVFSTVFTAVFASVSAILIYTSEAEHGTLGQAFTSQPRRNTVIAAKALAATTFAVVLALGGLAAGVLGTVLGGLDTGDMSAFPTTVGWAVAFAALAGLLGFGIGLVARQSAAAISGLLVWWLVVENLVAAFASEQIVRWMPFVAGNGMLGLAEEDEAIAFARPTTALIFAGYALLAVAVGTVVTHRSDP